MRPSRAAALSAFVLLASPAGGAEIPDGYRSERYRAPAPDRVPGGVTLDTGGLQALLAGEGSRLVLVDVSPLLRTAETDFDGTWIVAEERRNIPGSVWLPNVGYGTLDATMRAYLERELARATAGDRARPVVFYCYVDCWMSWNAARRAALEFGYSRVHWYPEGTDGWSERGLPLERGTPVPLVARAG